MDELGYYPNPAARRLRGQLKSTIGVIVPRIVNPFFSYLVNSIEQTAYENNFQVLIIQSNENKEKELSFLNLLKTRQIDGIIMTAIENDADTIHSYTQYGPILFCNEYLTHSPIPSIRVDQSKGAYLGTKHLIERGHSKIAYCTGGLFAEDGKDKDRNQGYQKALNGAGLSLNPNWIFIDQHTIEDGKTVLKQILKMDNQPTAIFTGSDEVAAGFMIEANDQNVKVPDDIAVIGFDDQPLAEMLHPKLTTIKQPISLMGEKAVEGLVKMMQKNNSNPENIELPVELIERKST